MITKRTQLCTLSELSLTPSLYQSKLKVNETNFTFGGKEYTLPKSEAELVPTPYKSGIFGYIARDPKDDEVFLLVDHVIKDGKDRPFRFKDHGLEAMYLLFTIDVPPNASNLEELDVVVYNIEKQ